MKNSHSGFGLVEVLIAAGLLGGLAVVLISLNKQSNVTMVKSKVDQEMLLMVNETVAILSDPQNCKDTLGGRNASLTATGIINDIKQKTRSKFAVNSEIGDAQLKINSYSLNASGPEVGLSSNTTHLIIGFQNKNILKGAPEITKRIRMYVDIDSSSNITNCRSLSSSSTDIWTRGSDGNIYYSGGRVGVMTTSPRSSLEVAGGVRAKKGSATAADSSDEGFSFENDGDTGVFAAGGSDTLGSTLQLKTDSDTGLSVKGGHYYGSQDCFDVTGAAGMNGSSAVCPAGSALQTGGASCPDGIHGYIHESRPNGNGWVADCYAWDGSGDSLAVAHARCCRVTPP